MIKSQDDLNQPETHSIEVLLSTIDELEKTKKQFEIAVKRIEFLKKKTASPYYGNNTYLKTIHQMCDKTLRQIKELEK